MAHNAAITSSPSGQTRTQSFNSDEIPDSADRAVKLAKYHSPRYVKAFEALGSFMYPDSLGIDEYSKQLCQSLLTDPQVLPDNTLFREDLYERALQLSGKNEARIVQDISRLIVPSAETLAIFGAEHLDVLAETVDAQWSNNISFYGIPPKPDYSVGFQRKAFSKHQLEKLAPFIGDYIAGNQSVFVATHSMLFPFLSCEVKCGNASLEVADRQNIHSMTLAVRGIVELYRLAGRGEEVNRRIVAFSVSHDARTARIFGHYAVIIGDSMEYYRHEIERVSIVSERWKGYKFTKNIYDNWMPKHLERLHSVIEQLPSKKAVPEVAVSRDALIDVSCDNSRRSANIPKSSALVEAIGELNENHGKVVALLPLLADSTGTKRKKPDAPSAGGYQCVKRNKHDAPPLSTLGLS